MKQHEHKIMSDDPGVIQADVSNVLTQDYTKQLIDSTSPYCKTMHCRKGMEVIIGGMKSAGFYYLSSGAIEVSYTFNDTRIVVALIGAGSFFGESGFFDRTSRIRDIRAVENSLIHEFDIESLNTMQSSNPVLFGQLMMSVAQSISKKFRRILDEREPMTAYAASLSTGRRTISPDDSPSDSFMNSREGLLAQVNIDTFKTQVFNLSCLLQKDTSKEIPDDLKLQGAHLFEEFNAMLDNFQKMDLDAESATSLWQYVFKETFPYVMRSRIAERSYFKPKGYAGDFMTIEMLYRNTPEGDGKIGMLVDEWCLQSSAARAVRGRRKLLADQLLQISNEKLKTADTVTIMNLACGPSRELADFVSTCGYSEKIRAFCVDIDPDALNYTNDVFNAFTHNASVSLMQENLIKWCLGRVDHEFELQDIIYSSGLMDYLDDQLFKSMINKCYEQLKPGGVLLLGNFSPANSIRMFMDHILDWKLIHRNETDLLQLFEGSLFSDSVKIIGEDQGINLFAVATKPE